MRLIVHILTFAIAILCPSHFVAKVESRFIFDATRCVELDEQLDKNTIQKLQSIGTLFPNGVFCYDVDNSKPPHIQSRTIFSKDNDDLSIEELLALLSTEKPIEEVEEQALSDDNDGGAELAASATSGDDSSSTSTGDVVPFQMVKKSHPQDFKHHQLIAMRPYQPFRVGGTIFRGKKKMRVAQQERLFQQ